MVSDANETQPDALPEGGQPSAEGKEPSTDATVNVHLDEDVDKIVKERHAKLDKQIADLTKEIAAYKTKEKDIAPLLERAEKLAKLSQAETVGKELGVPGELLTHLNTPEEMKAHAELLAKYIKPTTKEPFSGVGSGAGVDMTGWTAEQKIAYAVAHPQKKTS